MPPPSSSTLHLPMCPIGDEVEDDVASYSSSNGDRSTGSNRDPAVDVHGHVLSHSDDNLMEMQILDSAPITGHNPGQHVMDPPHPHPHSHSSSHDIVNIADDRRVLLAITVEINDGQIELLSVRDGDCLEDLATKFCKDHSISDDYVPPLTHHLASKLQSFGKEVTQDIEMTNPTHTSERHNHTSSLYEKTKPELCTHRLCSLKSLGSQEIPKVKTRKPTGHHVLPSFATLAKFQKVTEKKVEPQRSPQLSPKSKAVYTRLYVEFLHQKQRMEEEQQASLAQYRERLERDRPAYTKVWTIQTVLEQE